MHLDDTLALGGAAFALALTGGVHCAAMCGGFVGALQARRPAHLTPVRFALASHGGRLLGYGLAGALLGLLGAGIFLRQVLPLQIALLVLASLLLVAVALSLLGVRGWMRRLEPLGGALWSALRPLASRWMPPRSLPAAVGAGLVWGWIPCGMVYAALPLSLVAGGAIPGAIVMLAFGAGTLPATLSLAWGSQRLGALASGPRLRRSLGAIAGIAVLVFALSDLAHAARLAGAGGATVTMLASLCHAPD